MRDLRTSFVRLKSREPPAARAFAMKVAIALCNWRRHVGSIGHSIIRQVAVNPWLVSCAVYRHETSTRGIGSRRDGLRGCAAIHAGCASPFDVCLFGAGARRRHRRIVPDERFAVVDARHRNSGAICGSTITKEARVMEVQSTLPSVLRLPPIPTRFASMPSDG